MNTETRTIVTAVGDGATAARQARYGRLPDRVSHDDLVEEREGSPSGSTRGTDFTPWQWTHTACLAIDLVP
ncbi:hypothetical protein FH609_004850 [Streptomyces sp. 3MP-14]|uniref:Uncharacterized protein n=1 Tax=Streptomyces mimosae TaxID=2586635 RepID=A0A5N6APM6_9ACTN|nr:MULTISPECIES: hypothetical protein [Streptomyces]KAB8169639.1 hypothetical protein FH607_002530 [Streptomyces mimosae]KAB8178387.1 hypothetical protein FH609_004850 [Streptomyces sp. 3MP-14]